MTPATMSLVAITGSSISPCGERHPHPVAVVDVQLGGVVDVHQRASGSGRRASAAATLCIQEFSERGVAHADQPQRIAVGVASRGPAPRSRRRSRGARSRIFGRRGTPRCRQHAGAQVAARARHRADGRAASRRERQPAAAQPEPVAACAEPDHGVDEQPRRQPKTEQPQCLSDELPASPARVCGRHSRRLRSSMISHSGAGLTRPGRRPLRWPAGTAWAAGSGTAAGSRRARTSWRRAARSRSARWSR